MTVEPVRVSSMQFLHPKATKAFLSLYGALVSDFEAKKTSTLYGVYETFRSPERQAWCVLRGASKAQPFDSAHQYGLAVDFVPIHAPTAIPHLHLKPSWNWAEGHDWEHLKITARRYGLDVPIAWDRVHVQHPLFARIKSEERRWV